MPNERQAPLTAVLEHPTPVEQIDHDLDSAPEPDATAPDTTADTSADQPQRPKHGDSAGEYLWLDPHKLTPAPNRETKPASDTFDKSIAKYGNFLPLITRRTGPDAYEVHDGWHRTLSLRKTDWLAGCIVLPENASQADIDREIERIARQFVTGGQRFDQSEKDRYGAAKQILDLGVTIKNTAELLVGMPVKEIRAVKKVSASPNVEQVHHDGGLDLLQAQQVSDTFGDDREIANILAAAAAEHMFEHRFQQLIRERAERDAAKQAEAEAQATRERLQDAYEQAVREFTERGFIVLDEPEPEDGDPYPQLSDLVTASRDAPTASGDAPTAQDITSPQNFAVRLVQEVRRGEDNELIDLAEVDELTAQHPHEPAAEGYYHASDVIVHEAFVPIYYCLDLEAEGFALADPDDGNVFHDDADVSQNDSEVSQEDADQAAARRAEQIARQHEEERKRAEDAAERARQIKRATALNTMVRDATEVRRQQVSKMLFGGNRRVPEGAWELIGKVVQHPEMLDRYHAKILVHDLAAKVPNAPQSKGITARDNHGALRTLARVVAALEAHLQPTENSTGGADAWRRPSSFYKDYFEFLRKAIKYAPAPIERMLAGELTIEQVLDEPAPAPTNSDATPDDTDDTATAAEPVSEQGVPDHNGALGDDAGPAADHDD